MLAAPPFSLLENFDRVDDAIDANADIAALILATALVSFGLDPKSTDWHDTAMPSDMDKAKATIRQFYRDWSHEGDEERASSYGLVINAIEQHFRHTSPRSAVKVLVPGAGLGRLVWHLCAMGYTVEGNEISYHQLMASNWILNHVQPDSQHVLYPFALDFSNHLERKHQLQSVKVPDVHPETWLSPNGETCDRMSMTASDFILLYSDEAHQNIFDIVATVFFVDTAPNIIAYIETVWNCLKDGGIWVNIGPLLWHFADRSPAEADENPVPSKQHERMGIEAPGSVEVTNEELLLLLKQMGFYIEMHEIRNDPQGYLQNPHSMLQYQYRCSHWVARKVVKP